MVRTNAIEVLIAVATAFQFYVAVLLVRRGGTHDPLRSISALLLLLNGLVGVAFVAGRWGMLGWLGLQSVDLAQKPFDLPTNFLLFFLAWAIWSRPVDGRQGWTTSLRIGVSLALTAGFVAGVVVAATGTIALRAGLEFVLQQLPVYVGYSLLLLAATHRWIRRGEKDAALWSLVLVGYGARPVQFGFDTGTTYLLGFPGLSAGWVTVPNALSHVLLLAVAAYCIAALLLRMILSARAKEVPTPRWPVLALVASAVLGLVIRWNAGDPIAAPLQLVTLVAARPLLLGWAFDERGTLNMLAWLGTWWAGVLFFKAILAQALGQSVWEISTWDLWVVGLAIIFLPVSLGMVRRLRASLDRRTNAGADGKKMAPRAQRRTRSDRVLLSLLEAHATEPESWIRSERLASLAEVTEANLGRDISQARDNLLKAGGEKDGRNLLQIRISHEGPQVRMYRLTARGAELAGKLVHAEGGESDLLGRIGLTEKPPRPQ